MAPRSLLRPQSFATLRYLIANANRLVSKAELHEAIWLGVAVTDDSLVQCIHAIRRALGDDDRSLLQTVSRRGYRLNLPDDRRGGAGRRLDRGAAVRDRRARSRATSSTGWPRR